MAERTVPNIPRWLKHAPLVTWAVVYFLTCVVGALLILWNYRPFVLLFEYFSGVALELPSESGTLVVLYALLLGAPFLVWGGYLTGWRLGMFRGRANGKRRKINPPGSWKFAVATFGVCLTTAIWSLIHGGAFNELTAWFQYDLWVQARWQLFSRLGFFEFVNIYLFLPLATGWLFVEAGSGNWRRKALSWFALIITPGVAVLLFQKKSVITALFLIMSILGLWRIRTRTWPKYPVRMATVCALVLAVVYFALVVLPLYRQIEAQTQAELQTQEEKRKKWLESLLEEFGGFEDRKEAIFFYAMLAPLTRTSTPAIYYPIVFPREHPYYGIDMGQDILGFGEMPDDNKVVWKRMNPTVEGGSVAAPFHFVLYSQVGLSGAMVGSFLLGCVLGWSWFFVLVKIRLKVIGVMVGSLVMLLATYLAIDSVRNSLLVSYGVGWGGLFLFWVWLAVKFGTGVSQQIKRSDVPSLSEGK